ncbi:FAD-binding oxidoreductase [Roseateles saccharophilus]|uniref:FAD/FMN-containing dehydrogenase n=1 Tax=Roseateles saccharophilus TaxID=304 RepID=A0A4R3VE37_ROSSA|nr:FAD-binding oxidoreductase [Roseateles saccharophilus]MDG0832194.1 FAD-binding oxidoreductase [Roseateles saccharophilus]TCV02431.1 FAD/FMN-containing dehydrogenase [Roseateles saccharophilus]
MTPFLDALRQRLGEAGLLIGGDLSAYESDWRKRYPGRALAVARPASTAEVAAVLRLCQEHRVPVVPQGGNTGLVGGSTPDDSGGQLVLSLARMKRVRSIDAANASLTAEAGCVLADVQAAAAGAGLLFPLSLAAEGSCTLGGNLATNAGGTQVLRYGNARELCLGLEVVTAAGEVWQGLSGLRKDNTGYDLRDLFIGSEGTLGIITAATMKLYPQPRDRLTALAACASLDDAVALLGLARARAGDALTGFEVMSQASLALLARELPQLQQPLGAAAWTVLLELSDAESVEHARAAFEGLLGAAIEGGCVQDAAIAQSLQQALAFWHLRESIPLAQAQAGLNIKHDISLPVSAVSSFVAEMDAALAAYLPGIAVINFGHLGDGNLHYNVQAPAGVAPAEFLAAHEAAINAKVYDAVQRRGGSISAEHGIGRLKREELGRRKDPVALGLMRAIKKALDPQGLLNPGRLL